MLGALAMKSRWRKKRAAAGKSAAKPNLICGLVHSCWQMFARYFDVELRQIPCEGRRLMMSADEVIKRCDENTIGVVPTLGTTFTLQYEPVQAAAMALDDLEEEHGLDIPMHIDAASGGFIAPFVHPSVVWDFRIPRVKSINASGHKFGLAAQLRMDRLARGTGSSGRTCLQREVPGRQHADLFIEFFASCGTGCRTVLQLRAAWPRRLYQDHSGQF